MERPLELAFHGMASSPALEARIRDEVAKLERFVPKLQGCRVVVERTQHRHRKGDLYRVGIDLTVPGREIAVTRTGPKDHAHEDVKVALRDAFAAATRRLQDRTAVVRGEVKQHVEPLTGHVVRLFHDEGYGFVHTDTGDVYMHRNAVVDDGFDRLEVGAEVRLEIAEGESPQGWQATTVTPTGNVLKVSG